jgi:hypothetical protein
MRAGESEIRARENGACRKTLIGRSGNTDERAQQQQGQSRGRAGRLRATTGKHGHGSDTEGAEFEEERATRQREHCCHGRGRVGAGEENIELQKQARPWRGNVTEQPGS